MSNSRRRRLVAASRFTYGPGETTTVHTHDTHQLVYAVSGVLTLSVRDARWVVPPLRAVWVPAGVPHQLLAHGETDTRPLYIDASVRLGELTDIAVVSVSALLRELILELTERPPAQSLERHHIEELIILQLDHMTQRSLKLVEPRDSRLLMIHDGLMRDPADRRTLRQWGTAVGAGERTLVRLFASETGTSFGHWRNQIRLHHALVLLASGTSVTRVSHQCGYHSTSAFIQRFRSTLGTTPGRYFEREAEPVLSRPRG